MVPVVGKVAETYEDLFIVCLEVYLLTKLTGNIKARTSGNRSSNSNTASYNMI